MDVEHLKTFATDAAWMELIDQEVEYLWNNVRYHSLLGVVVREHLRAMGIVWRQWSSAARWM